MDNDTADDPTALLARDRQQLLALLQQLQTLGSDADRNALVGRIGGRLRALAAIEAEVAAPDTDATQRHDRMAALVEQLAASDGDAADAIAALERELHAHDAAPPRLPDSADTQALCERIRARRAELLLDEKPD